MTTTTAVTATHTASATRPDWLLRFALALDGGTSLLFGVALAALGPVVDDRLGVPVGLSLPVGLFLVVFGGMLSYLSRRPRISTGAVLAVVVFNVVWAVDSALLVVFDWATLTTAGAWAVAVQAVAVAGVAGLELAGLRQARRAGA